MIDILPAGPTTVNLQQPVCCCKPMLGRTDGRTLYPALRTTVKLFNLAALKVGKFACKFILATNFGKSICTVPSLKEF